MTINNNIINMINKKRSKKLSRLRSIKSVVTSITIQSKNVKATTIDLARSKFIFVSAVEEVESERPICRCVIGSSPTLGRHDNGTPERGNILASFKVGAELKIYALCTGFNRISALPTAEIRCEKLRSPRGAVGFVEPLA
jgi:hypothetical protein